MKKIGWGMWCVTVYTMAAPLIAFTYGVGYGIRALCWCGSHLFESVMEPR